MCNSNHGNPCCCGNITVSHICLCPIPQNPLLDTDSIYGTNHWQFGFWVDSDSRLSIVLSTGSSKILVLIFTQALNFCMRLKTSKHAYTVTAWRSEGACIDYCTNTIAIWLIRLFKDGLTQKSFCLKWHFRLFFERLGLGFSLLCLCIVVTHALTSPTLHAAHLPGNRACMPAYSWYAEYQDACVERLMEFLICSIDESCLYPEQRKPIAASCTQNTADIETSLALPSADPSHGREVTKPSQTDIRPYITEIKTWLHQGDPGTWRMDVWPSSLNLDQCSTLAYLYW